MADMLTARLDDTDPSGFRTAETPTEEFDGEHVVTSAFIEFETAAGRGKGHLRLRDELGWTLLTTCRSSRATRSVKAPTVRWAPCTARIRTGGHGPRSASTRI